MSYQKRRRKSAGLRLVAILSLILTSLGITFLASSTLASATNGGQGEKCYEYRWKTVYKEAKQLKGWYVDLPNTWHQGDTNTWYDLPDAKQPPRSDQVAPTGTVPLSVYGGPSGQSAQYQYKLSYTEWFPSEDGYHPGPPPEGKDWGNPVAHKKVPCLPSVAPTGAGSAVAECNGTIQWEYTVTSMGDYTVGWLFVAATGVPSSNPHIFNQPETYHGEFTGMDISISNTVGFALVYDQETGAMIGNDVVVPPAEGCEVPTDPSVEISIALDECDVVGTITRAGFSGGAGFGLYIGTDPGDLRYQVVNDWTEADSVDFRLDDLAPGTYYVQGEVIDYATGLAWASNVASVEVPQSCEGPPVTPPPTNPPTTEPPTTEPPTEPTVPPTTPTEPTAPPTKPTTPPTEPPTAPPATQPPTTPAPTGTVPVAPNTDGSGSGMMVAWLLIATGLVLFGGSEIARRKLS